MPPSKAARGGQDDHKADGPTGKEKNGNTGGSKMRRVASSAGSNLREVTNASSTTAPTTVIAPDSTTTNTQETSAPGLQWPAFERDVLHAYRRAYRLKTPTAFVSDHHEWVLTQPGSIGLYSPTIARRQELRRQKKDQLTNVVRKHFNGMGVQENDVLVDFLHKVRSRGVTKGKSPQREYIHANVER
ncbi:hypothetical protein B0J18DRAFT_407068 [Chaetomium sp. MPI-SDFR-AT-0129]|nr:hypothetical protein B0J18DRAFT_407068 [Chaetomium sp. MPI-SDFR-AT-0129]